MTPNLPAIYIATPEGESAFNDPEFKQMLATGFPARAKAVPGSGMIQVGDVATTGIVCVIINYHILNIMWPPRSNTPQRPVCWSVDGIKPDIQVIPANCQSDYCASCDRNLWKEKGKPKECKNLFRIYVLPENGIEPITMTIPITSVRAFRQFITDLRVNHQSYSKCLIQISAYKGQTANFPDVTMFKFSFTRKLEEPEHAKIREYKSLFVAKPVVDEVEEEVVVAPSETGGEEEFPPDPIDPSN